MIQIQSFKRVIPMIYAYNTVGVVNNEGWTKIGYTERQTVKERIRQQSHTISVPTKIAWTDNAMYKDGSGEYFTDHDFHRYLEKKKVERRPKTEWFHVDGKDSQAYFNAFANRLGALQETEGATYSLMSRKKR